MSPWWFCELHLNLFSYQCFSRSAAPLCALQKRNSLYFLNKDNINHTPICRKNLRIMKTIVHRCVHVFIHSSHTRSPPDIFILISVITILFQIVSVFLIIIICVIFAQHPICVDDLSKLSCIFFCVSSLGRIRMILKFIHKWIPSNILGYNVSVLVNLLQFTCFDSSAKALRISSLVQFRFKFSAS